MAYRKAVLEKKMRAEEKSRKVEISDLENDRSSNKSTSHLRLVALAVQIKEDGFVRLYKKAELRQLCEAYMVSVVAKWNKRRIAKELLQKLAICDKMPCHHLYPDTLLRNYLQQQMLTKKCQYYGYEECN